MLHIMNRKKMAKSGIFDKICIFYKKMNFLAAKSFGAQSSTFYAENA